MGINFTMVASPGFLERAPHTHIATVRVAPAGEAGVLRAVTDALPNVSGIRVADVLGAVADLVGKIAAALAATGSITLAAGALGAGGRGGGRAAAADGGGGGAEDARRDAGADPRGVAGGVRASSGWRRG